MRFLTTNSSKKDIVLKLITLLTLVLAVMMLPGCLGQKQEQVRKEMTAYLNERYGLEFVVGKPYLTGSGLTTHYEAIAYPKGQPEIKFEVYQNYNTGDPKDYGDNYLLKKWSYQGKLEIAKKLRQVYGESVDFRIVYRFGDPDYAFKDLDFAEAFKKSRGKGQFYLFYDLFVDGTQINKLAEAEKAYKIMKPFVLDYGGAYYDFAVVYINKAYKQEYLENMDKYQNDGEYRKLFNERKTLGYLLVRQSPLAHIEVSKGSDLVKYFEY